MEKQISPPVTTKQNANKTTAVATATPAGAYYKANTEIS